MKLRLEILPKAQIKLWPLLSTIPNSFTLYGGTAIALQLGHRESIDFDFFSAEPLNKDQLLITAPFLIKSQFTLPDINTLNCYVELEEGTVKFQFLAGLNTRQGRVDDPYVCEDNGIRIATLRDLFATKLNTIQLRAEIKDYIDIDAILRSGLSLKDGLACAVAIFGENFDVATSLRALCSYRDGDLPQLPKTIQNNLSKTALAVEDIPTITAKNSTIAY